MLSVFSHYHAYKDNMNSFGSYSRYMGKKSHGSSTKKMYPLLYSMTHGMPNKLVHTSSCTMQNCELERPPGVNMKMPPDLTRE
jgi:hypothetical protein